MQNTNRLIDDFKNQTKTTIWKHLDAMAANYVVYSTHLNGLDPFLNEYDVYLYCNETNVVVVCLDCCGNGDDQIYEESESLGLFTYNEGDEPRVSVVRRLAEAVKLIKETRLGYDSAIKVYGVLLTEAEILNSYKLQRLWDDADVMVIDGFRRLKYRKIKVNEDDCLDCKAYISKILDANHGILDAKHGIMDANYGIMEGQAPMTSDILSENDELNLDDFPKGSVRIEDEDDDEFSKLLDQFLKEGMEVVDEKPDAEDDEDEEDPEEDVEEDPEEEFFPNGEIEQNLNVNVKVDILRPIANPREELDKLVGCADIKRRMDELVALTSYNKMMRDLFPDSKQHEVSLHSVFLGRPGTGKTTVCKIFGSLLRKVGALSKGHVVVCDRGTFIGTLWGDEERSMKQVLKMAQGGVLMIDEAYLLASKNENDPGRLVIQLLMNVLADETQRDIAVVLCGYKEPMMKLLDSNPGLYSRFPNKFEFADFTVDELLEITQCRVKDYDYQFTAKAWEKYRQVLLQAYQVRNPETWGNARFVANQLERIYIQHATRCVKHQPKDKRELLKITPEDILPIEVPRQKAKIGF
ncbi:ATPase family associated with various cellular activities (AAA) [Prevotella sp. tc2-28]|uniref:AAA family ATPase n=1 Tax=Prevotella sp. tc2-28 TaxID=1761888 RepID=UPI00089D51CC|nr:AAA family ATPase [Prevotella sp. tc2-28]SEA55492.1 ATPase family associated with various cellular activities (AAA) [Prevotella sp. tc2-28]